MSQDKEREALLHYKRVYSEISAILACRAEMPPPNADDEITVQRLKALVKECEVYADSCAAKAERIDRLGEMVERLSAENKELRAALATQPPAVQGEPFCYHHQLVLNDSSGIIDGETNSQPTMEPWFSGCRVETIPLYTSPPSREVEPLTDEALAIAMTNSYYDAASFIAGVRFAEIHHGIHSRGEGGKA